MKKITHTVLLLINLFWAASYAALQPGEGMVFVPSTGNYLYSYRDGSGGPNDPLVQITFIPSTKIEPVLSSSTKLIDNWHIRYGFTLANGANAKQSIVSLSIFGLPANVHITGTTTTITEGNNQMELFEPTMTVPNSDWYGSGTRNLGRNVNISWYCLYDSIDNPDPNLGIRPGKKLGGFSFISRDLPGLIAAQMQGGGTGDIGFPGYAPGGEILDLYEQLRKNDFAPRNAAVPMIVVPSPFDAVALLDRIRAHVATWPSVDTPGYGGNVPPGEKIFLLDPAFAAQLDRYLAAAADAYRRNQTKAGKEHIKTLRKMLKKEHEDADRDDDKEDEKHEGKSNHKAKRPPIDRLAARVLDFDLKYVLKRTGGDKDD